MERQSSTVIQSSGRPSGRCTRAQAAHDRSAATRARIIAAAGPLFVEHGYLDTTVSAIAKAAGVAVQTLYLSFPGKIAVLEAAVAAAGAGADPRGQWPDDGRAQPHGPRAPAHHPSGARAGAARGDPPAAALRAG